MDFSAQGEKSAKSKQGEGRCLWLSPLIFEWQRPPKKIQRRAHRNGTQPDAAEAGEAETVGDAEEAAAEAEDEDEADNGTSVSVEAPAAVAR